MKKFDELKALILAASSYPEIQHEINLLKRSELIDFLIYHDRHGDHGDETREMNNLCPYNKELAAFISYAVIKKQSYEKA